MIVVPLLQIGVYVMILDFEISGINTCFSRTMVFIEQGRMLLMSLKISC